MFRFSILLCSSVALASCGGQADGDAEQGVSAEVGDAGSALQRADLIDPQGEAIGFVEYSDDDGSISLTVEATGLGEGMHAVHLHESGNCDTPDFKSAGGHWNPTDKQHGRDNPQGAHMGDLSNMSVGDDGAGRSDFIVAEASIEGGRYPLADSDGTALVIHAGPDDYRTDPAGDAGARVACAVLAPAV